MNLDWLNPLLFKIGKLLMNDAMYVVQFHFHAVPDASMLDCPMAMTVPPRIGERVIFMSDEHGPTWEIYDLTYILTFSGPRRQLDSRVRHISCELALIDDEGRLMLRGE